MLILKVLFLAFIYYLYLSFLVYYDKHWNIEKIKSDIESYGKIQTGYLYHVKKTWLSYLFGIVLFETLKRII